MLLLLLFNANLFKEINRVIQKNYTAIYKFIIIIRIILKTVCMCYSCMLHVWFVLLCFIN